MPFDIDRDVFGEDFVDDEAAADYEEELLKVFAASPESRELGEGEEPSIWVRELVDLGIHHLGVTPARMSVTECSEIVFEIFPRKISCAPEDATEIVRHLAAFWKFVAREFGLPHAQECLGMLGPRAIGRLEAALADPANYGMAKSFVMWAVENGFDVQTKSSLDQAMFAYNSQLRVLPTPHAVGQTRGGASSSSSDREERRRRRKAERARRKGLRR